MKKTALLILLLALIPVFAFSKNVEAYRFNDEILDSLDKPTMFMFGENWCQPCIQMIPIMEKIADEREDVDIYYIDLEKVPEALDYVPMIATPTSAFYLPGGEPYYPTNNISQYLMYQLTETGEHVLTTRLGYLNGKELNSIFDDMVEESERISH